MSDDFDQSEASDAVPDLPKHDDDTYDENNPRQQFSRLDTERILQLTDVSYGSSSMLTSGSTLPTLEDDEEKAKGRISNMDASANVRKLDPPLRRPESEPTHGQTACRTLGALGRG